MAVISGKDGNLTRDGVQLCPIINWTLSRTSNNPDYAANDTGGKKARVKGVTDSSGTFILNSEAAPVAEGDKIVLLLETGVSSYSEDAIVDEISTECDITDGGIVAWTVNWSGDVAAPVCSSG